jgi:hypothetical protein
MRKALTGYAQLVRSSPPAYEASGATRKRLSKRVIEVLSPDKCPLYYYNY